MTAVPRCTISRSRSHGSTLVLAALVSLVAATLAACSDAHSKSTDVALAAELSRHLNAERYDRAARLVPDPKKRADFKQVLRDVAMGRTQDDAWGYSQIDFFGDYASYDFVLSSSSRPPVIVRVGLASRRGDWYVSNFYLAKSP